LRYSVPKNATFALHADGAAMSGLNDRTTTVRRGFAADLLQVQQTGESWFNL
jgi:hypothetical protein